MNSSIMFHISLKRLMSPSAVFSLEASALVNIHLTKALCEAQLSNITSRDLALTTVKQWYHYGHLQVKQHVTSKVIHACQSL